MQIDFVPHKIRASKAYIAKLIEEEQQPRPIKKKEKPLSFFQKLVKVLFK
ncbi:MAG: hypothetical protein K0U38_06355 [Epsilonproteobacteria bacterium]|nr:hypothetical protein [Campylobacterota bacterium]